MALWQTAQFKMAAVFQKKKYYFFFLFFYFFYFLFFFSFYGKICLKTLLTMFPAPNPEAKGSFRAISELTVTFFPEKSKPNSTSCFDQMYIEIQKR